MRKYNYEAGNEPGPPPHSELQRYTYQLPQPGKLLHNSFLGVITDHWVLSGISTMQTGSPFTPGVGESPSVDITGSSSLGARIQVIGPGQASGPGANYAPNSVNQPTYFNTAAFYRTCGGRYPRQRGREYSSWAWVHEFRRQYRPADSARSQRKACVCVAL